MGIEIGKKYRHSGTGKTVTVVGKNMNVFTVTGIFDGGRHAPAFGSELEPIYTEEVEDKVESHGQTMLSSFIESWVNIVIGFTINFTANMLILPLFGFTGLTLGKNFVIGLVYTVISLVRSFVIRRYFNGLKWGNK